jgi:hypothetical protein
MKNETDGVFDDQMTPLLVVKYSRIDLSLWSGFWGLYIFRHNFDLPQLVNLD